MKEIIAKLEDISNHVICINMNTDEDNISLAVSNGGVNPDQAYFQHKTREWKIIFFFETDHLFKFMMNNILKNSWKSKGHMETVLKLQS